MRGISGQEQSDEQLLEQYRECIVELGGDPQVYAYRENGRETAYVFELEGPGLLGSDQGFCRCGR